MSNLSRADLLRLLKAQTERGIVWDAKALALQFHYHYDENAVSTTLEKKTLEQGQETRLNLGQSTALYTAPKQYEYWYVAECKAKAIEKIEDNLLFLPESIDSDTQPADNPLVCYSLLSAGQWQNLWDKHLTNAKPSQAIDISKAVKHLAQGQPVQHLPKVIRQRWNKGVVLILDRTKELRPLWPDMREAWLSLLALMGEEQLQTFYLEDGPQGRWAQPEMKADGGIDRLAYQATVVMIGAFGGLETGTLSANWLQLTQQLEQRGHRLVMLSVNRIPSRHASTHPLDPKSGQSTEKLLTALALVWKPSLNQLRHLRLAIQGASLLDELKVYNHQEVERLGGRLNLQPKGLLQRLQLLEGLDDIHALKHCAQQWQPSLSRMGQEIERFQRNLQGAPKLEDYRLLHGLAKAVQQGIKAGDSTHVLYSLMGSMLPLTQLLAEQNPEKAWQPFLSVAQTVALQQGRPLPLQHQGLQSKGSSRGLRQVNQQLILVENKNHAILPLGDQAYCVQTQKVIGNSLETEHKQLEIIDQGYYWRLDVLSQPDWSERFWQDRQDVFAAHTDNALFFLQAASAENPKAQWICQYNPWSWASSAGIDKYGLWADLQIKEVVYRLRWIKPGQFIMGSADTEKEREDDEVPHQVTLTQGYWLGETSCTQALWQAVMDDNPSDHKTDLQLPVETVSWNDCQLFVAKLFTFLPDFIAQLPTEAQWEYACRAGTKTAYWWGDKMNDRFAYENISETRLELDYPANDFGLKSMSGNVGEWCADRYGDYSTTEALDPAGSKKGQDRVLRGGSWYIGGRRLRSASRLAFEPDLRGRNMGFRLAGGLDPKASKLSYTASRGPWNGQATGGIGQGKVDETTERVK